MGVNPEIDSILPCKLDVSTKEASASEVGTSEEVKAEVTLSTPQECVEFVGKLGMRALMGR